MVDHFTGGWAERRDADAVLAFLRSIFDVRPRAFTIAPEVHALRADAIVCTAVLTAPADDGDQIELVFLNLMHYRPEGIDRVESWPADRLDDALAVFHALGAANVVSNRCTEAQRDLCRAVGRRDWDAMRAQFAPDFDGYDDRNGFVSFDEDPVKGYRVATELGVVEMAHAPIAVRGESVALVEATFRGRGDDAFEVRVLTVNEVDPDGRFVYHANFDLDALDDAIADLEHRYSAGEGAPFADMLRLVARGTVACNSRDWDALRVRVRARRGQRERRVRSGLGNVAGSRRAPRRDD